MKNLKNFSNQQILVAPSLLAADFSDLRTELNKVESAGAELLHLDIMDAHFVPNLSYGPPVVASLRAHTSMLFDAHLMLTHPSQYVEPFSKCGVEHITFHVECSEDTQYVIDSIKNAGCTVGLSVKPKTPIESIFPFLNQLDLVLIMSVEPGFGGQSFMPEVMDKVKILREISTRENLSFHIQVDGGVDAQTAPIVKAAGANVLVAGTAVFRYPEGVSRAVTLLRS